MAIKASPYYYVNALMQPYTWTDTAAKAYNFTYAFDNARGYTVPEAMKAAYLSAAHQWENVANIHFYGTANVAAAQIKFSLHDLSSEGASVIGETYEYIYRGTSKLALAQVVLDDRFATAASVASGTLGYLTLMHEIGHAIGLKHPGDYNGESGRGTGAFLPAAEDTLNASIMSYHNSAIVTQSGTPPITPQLYDIAAVQYMYGANYAYNSGNTSYVISGASNAQTIWDGSGNDTIDGSRLNTDSMIDLNEGLTHYSHIGSSFVWAAFGANIENAIGGNGNDAIDGNALNNVLTGNGGNDSIFGETGNDTLNGGLGNDILNGGAGNDFLVGGGGNDTMVGGAGVDTFYFEAASAQDTIQQFEGAGVAGGDIIRLAGLNMDAGNFASLARLIDAITYAGGNTVIHLGGSNDITLVGSTAHLVAGDFQIG